MLNDKKFYQDQNTASLYVKKEYQHCCHENYFHRSNQNDEIVLRYCVIVVQENVFVSEIFPGFATLSVNRLKGLRVTLLAKTLVQCLHSPS